jgi:prepilin-type N-terminal cleavage/methylation domain-containing protein/prepilin-type processing-associated H-X9-DG protein
MTSRRRRHRQGFTLIELLVVISIIGILVGLLLPAITAAREAGRRAKCQSNMRNVVLGILGYVTTNNVLPPSGEFGEDPTPSSVATFQADPSKGAVITWTTGGGDGTGATTPMYSWVVPILPYLDSAELFNQWTMFNGSYANGCVPYNAVTSPILGQASNNKIAETAIGVLICPDDNTIQTGQGNLSYVVNGGFALYQAYPIGWVGSPIDGQGAPSVPLIWSNNGLAATIGVTSKLGVMFPESTYAQGIQIRVPYNVRSSLTAIADGASNTILMSENTLTGANALAPNASNLTGWAGNWACPFPNFTSFIGASNVCGGKSYTFPTSVDCTAGQLSPVGDTDGLGWSLANKVGTNANIGGGQNFTAEGLYPFSNSAHPGGCNMGFCDGAVRFISNTIDGTVYSKLITPAGSKLPAPTPTIPGLKQMPLNQDSFAQ